MTDQPPVKRRMFLADPGDEPLLTADPIDYYEGFDRFVEATGIDPARVVSTPVVRFPIPVARKDASGQLERWSGITPSMMWLPLFWLPPHLALRYQYQLIDPATGGTSDDMEIESDEAWAIRVMLELVYAGLYDPKTGTWADVLSRYGLDADNPVDQARIEMWLDGFPDEDLDRIDLTADIVHPDNPEWALQAARDYADVLVPAQWSLSASGLLVACGNHLAHQGNTEQVRRTMLTVLGSVAVNSLRALPAADEDSVPVSDAIESLVIAAQNDEADDEKLVDDFLVLLAEVSEDYEPYLNGYLEATGAAGAAAAS